MSVGHTARILEAAGIPTVTVMAGPFAFRAEGMKLPRSVVTRHPSGRPLGPPGDTGRHAKVVRTALELLASAQANATLVELADPYRPGG